MLALALWGPWAGLGEAFAADGPAEVDAVELAAVVRALSARDGASCEAVEALASQPVATLLAVVEEVRMPPYAPMRAAGCLVSRHATAVQPDLERWVVDPQTKGLGRLVLGAFDQMPVAVAVPVARKALSEGTDRELASKRAAAAATPEIRALVGR